MERNILYKNTTKILSVVCIKKLQVYLYKSNLILLFLMLSNHLIQARNYYSYILFGKTFPNKIIKFAIVKIPSFRQ